MSETINTYPMNDPEKLIPMDRSRFYAEQVAIFKETGKPTKAVDIIDILLFNTHGEVLLQKRSYHKGHNAGLIDKSMGGHVKYGDTNDYTVMVETVQELQTPSIVLKNRQDFEKTLDLLYNYLDTLAVVCHVTSEIHILPKKIADEQIDIANRTHLYLGVYNGRVRPADQEAQGVLWYSLEDLNRELTSFPETFTEDLKFLLKEYHKDIEEFIEKAKDK